MPKKSANTVIHKNLVNRAYADCEEHLKRQLLAISKNLTGEDTALSAQDKKDVAAIITQSSSYTSIERIIQKSSGEKDYNLLDRQAQLRILSEVSKKLKKSNAQFLDVTNEATFRRMLGVTNTRTKSPVPTAAASVSNSRLAATATQPSSRKRKASEPSFPAASTVAKLPLPPAPMEPALPPVTRRAAASVAPASEEHTPLTFSAPVTSAARAHAMHTDTITQPAAGNNAESILKVLQNIYGETYKVAGQDEEGRTIKITAKDNPNRKIINIESTPTMVTFKFEQPIDPNAIKLAIQSAKKLGMDISKISCSGTPEFEASVQRAIKESQDVSQEPPTKRSRTQPPS